jgi:CRP/FNR family cyclic AMP-dependent transcriptional regulator
MANLDPAIRRIGDPVLRELAAGGAIRRFPKGSVMIREDDPGHTLFVLLSGKAKVYVSDAQGRQMTLRHCEPEDYVGEMSLDGKPRSASVCAQEPTVCVEVSRERLLESIRADPEFALRMVLALIGRTRRLTHSLKDLALMDVYGRIARLLRELDYEETGGQRWSRERLTQKEIASRVGASRDMVGKILKDLRAGGYIDMRDKRFRILRRPPARW